MLSPFNEAVLAKSATTTREFPFHPHIRPIEARAVFTDLGWDFDSYYRFTFVRNPWKRLASLYEMILRLDRNYRKPFDYWVRHSCVDGDGGGKQTWRRYGTYSLKNFAGDRRGRLLVNDVFRLEDIDGVPATLRDRGIPLPPDAKVPLVNRSPNNAPHRERYTPELIQLVADRYADEIAQFRYEF